MPDAWSDKDERMYKHVKKSERDSGKSQDKAEEIAARTVNKHRREDNRTPKSSTSGTGNPNTSLENRTVKELRNRARELNVSGRSSMTKSQLVSAIRNKS